MVTRALGSWPIGGDSIILKWGVFLIGIICGFALVSNSVFLCFYSRFPNQHDDGGDLGAQVETANGSPKPKQAKGSQHFLKKEKCLLKKCL